MATELYEGPLVASAVTMGSEGVGWTAYLFASQPTMASTYMGVLACNDALYSGVQTPLSGLTDSLTLTGFGAVIPTGAVIDNIEVDIWWQGMLTNDAQITTCQLVGAPGTPINLADNSYATATTTVKKAISGAKGLWSSDTTDADWVNAISPSGVSNPAFGVKLGFNLINSSHLSDYLRLYQVTMTIQYHMPGGGGIWQAAPLGVM